jgi:TPR repeat protein
MTTETQQVQPDAAEGDASAAMANTLQTLLSEISTRVGLADQRYTDIIGEMRDKLTALDSLAKESREKAEEQARIEAKRLADAEAQRLAEAEAKAEAGRIAEAKRLAEAEAEAEVQRQAEKEAARRKAEAEAAEAVEAAKAAAAAVVAKGKAAYADDVDPFDIIDHTPVRQREPWDRESADVFTRHFEEFTSHDGDSLPMRSHGPSPVVGPVAQIGEAGFDRGWLEGRFNDIASRIAEMMAGQPADLDERFGTLETRLDTAMATVTAQATSGSDTLKQIEGHIAEIDEHVDFIRKELARLDGMEAQIRAVIEIQKRETAKPPQATAGDESSEPAGMAQLTGLLQRLMAERRNTEEHTVSMLDTLQQAMIRVLDRVEAIEASPPGQARKAARSGESAGDGAETTHPGSEAQDVQGDGSAADAAAAAAAALSNDNLFMDFEEELGRSEQPALAESEADALNREELQSSIQQIRRNFVADAQRARERARGDVRRTPVTDRAVSPPVRSMIDRLLRPSNKQLAVVAVGLMIPLNALFLYLVLASSTSETHAGMRSAAEQGATLPDRLSEASQALASEPPISRAAPDLLTRINAPLAPEPASAQPADTTAASAPAGAKVEMPPATIGPLTLRRAAADGDASAQFEVAARLAEGKGIDQDFKSAVEWYLRSAASGFAQAQYRLGTHYERGLGVDRDAERARVWYQRAAEQGNVKAMHNLAVISAGKPDYPEAIRWFTEAAGYNLPDSQFNLAVLLEGGLGGPKDLKQAYLWFALAARGGDKEAMKRRDLVKAQLSADALAAADEEVRSFRTKPQIPLVNDARVAGEAWKKSASN